MPRILAGGRRDAKLGTTPSGKVVWLEKRPSDYKGWSASDHLYAAVLHTANRTRGGSVAEEHRALAGKGVSYEGGGERRHSTIRGGAAQTTAFDPPRTMNVVDRHGGFTAITRSGTLWRPGKAAPGGTLGALVSGSVKRDDFYQNKQPVVSALYKLPSYGYKVKVWWEPSGERIA